MNLYKHFNGEILKMKQTSLKLTEQLLIKM